VASSAPRKGKTGARVASGRKDAGALDSRLRRNEDSTDPSSPRRRGSSASKNAPSPAADLPTTFEPQLATLVDKPRPGDWLYEIKYDGYRMLARIASAADIRIFTRRGNDWTHRFERLRKELAAAGLPSGWYDGEIVMLDAQGKPSFNLLQNAIEGGDNDRIVFYLFDAPWLAGRDMRALPVEERRAALQQSFRETTHIRFSQEITGPVKDLVRTACEMGLEGVIGKRRGSIYVHRRSDDWIKLKCSSRQEFVIGGYTWPDHSRIGIGALLVGYHDEDGVFQYAGKVGTGYTGEMLAQLRTRLDAMAQPKRPFAGSTGHDRHATWVRPELLCEVTYAEWPEGKSLRHASFKGLREDKPAAQVQRESRPSRTAAKLTHPDKVIDRTTGFTKLQLAEYYAHAAPWLLPFLRGRPAYVRRAPTGLQGKMFFQQHPEKTGLRGTDPALWPGHEPAFEFADSEDLLAAVQLGVVEIHTWNSDDRAIARPDRLIFDIDPGEDVAWDQVREAAVLVRALLEELGLETWVRTTGGKGLHVVAPIQPEFDYPTAKGFTQAVVRHLAKTIPSRFVAISGPSNRRGRIFIDFLRNGQSQSTMEAYSARARPGMGVAMPIGWGELASVERADAWNIMTAIERLRSARRDPWFAYWKTTQSIANGIAALGSTPVD